VAEKINEFQKPYSTTQEEQDLRWKYSLGKMSFKEYEKQYRKLLKAGKIRRSGRTVKE